MIRAAALGCAAMQMIGHIFPHTSFVGSDKNRIFAANKNSEDLIYPLGIRCDNAVEAFVGNGQT